MNFLKRIQQQPEKTRKIIFWAIIIVLAVILIFVWLKLSQGRLAEFEMSSFIQDLNPPDLSNIEIPEMPNQVLEEIEQYAKEATTTE